MEELDKKSKKGLDKFTAEGGDLDKVFSALDSGIDNLLDNQSGPEGDLPDTSLKSKKIRNWLIILFGIILIGFLGYSLWKKTHQEVQPQVYYAQYFEVLPSPSNGVVRSESNTSFISDGFVAYAAKNYTKAADLLSQDVNNPESLVYSGIAYLQSDQPQKAASILELAADTAGITDFEDIRQWYLALAFLKLEKIAASKALLQSISTADHYKNQQAKDILNELK